MSHPEPAPRPISHDVSQTLYFAIPLKARATAMSWESTVRDFNRTLASIYNQTNPNFRILVACHDIPDLLLPTDSRLEFIPVDSPAPDLTKNPRSNFQDKEYKLKLAADRFREEGGCWFMALDADDVISSRLVEHVLAHPNPIGFIARRGYLLDQETRAMALVPDRRVYQYPFDKIAGCTIFRLTDKDFAPEPDGKSRFHRYVIDANHPEFWRMSIEENRPLQPLPFPAMAYVLCTGENHSLNYGRYRNWLKQNLIPALRTHGRRPDCGASREFALDHPLWEDGAASPAAARHPGDPEFKAAFIGCGGMKCGSTALWEHLKLHPQIGLARFKEMRYFNNDRNFPTAPDFDGYHSHFDKKDGARVYGEVTPLYLYHPSALRRIRQYNPDCKILCIFRNPIERAYSHWCMEVREGRETESFSDALERELARHRAASPEVLERSYDFSYVGCGLYCSQVRDIWKLFPPEQTLFIKTDDLRDDPGATMNMVYRFLGVAPIQVPRGLRARTGGYTTMASVRERRLLLDTFEFEIKALERMLGWNCSEWMKL